MKEVIVAAYIESLYNKREILELYLNKVYLGDGLYGFEAAARGYLAKTASDLTVDEAALLAGLIQSPSSYAPTVNRDRALARRAVVLQTMVASGAIDQATADSARKVPLRLANALEIKETSGLYFKEHVRRELVERFGWQRVYQGGLRVSTTIDPELQAAAERIVEKGLQDIERRQGYKYEPRASMVSEKSASGSEKENGAPDYLQGALVAFDPTNGYVRALVGGRDFDESRFNRAVQAKRQSGSAFKPFVFAAALEAGMSPASVITGLNDPILTAQGEWMPEDEHSDATSMTLRTALRTSSNRAAVQLLNTVGIPKAVDYAKKLNVGTPPSVPSLALGASDVTLIALTAAYGAFANGGWVRQPTFIRRVEDSDGNVLYNDSGKAEHAISENTAFLMSSMLSDVINAGTAYRARQSGFTLPAAGKTGTTNEYVDAWFVGFTPHLVTGVWLGFDQPKTIIRNGYAGELAVPIWGNFMKVATEGDKSEWLARPSTITGAERMPGVGAASEQRMQRRASGQSGGVGRDPLDDLHGVFRQGNPAVGDLPDPRIAVVPRSTRGDLRKGQPRNARLHGPGRHPDRARDDWHDAGTARRRYAQGLCARQREGRHHDRGAEEEAGILVQSVWRRQGQRQRQREEVGRAQETWRRFPRVATVIACPQYGLTPKRRTFRAEASEVSEAKADLHGRIPAVPCHSAILRAIAGCSSSLRARRRAALCRRVSFSPGPRASENGMRRSRSRSS